MNIRIDSSIKDKSNAFAIGVLSFQAHVKKEKELDATIAALEKSIQLEYSLESLLKTPGILDARNAYKQYGKDPSRYRLAVESLFRRIIKGNKLYRINNLVDVGNYASLLLKKSTAVLDADKIQGDILIRMGKEEAYEGIARGKINVQNIPVYVDAIGPFGSTTSDTPRTRITKDTKHVLVFLISFQGPHPLVDDLQRVKELFETYAEARNVKTWIVE